MSSGKMEPIKRSRLSEQVLDRIKEALVSGLYKPGDQLPNERDLAEQLEVSRASVREALRTLGNMGFIESKVGVNGGTYVRELTIDSIIDPFSEMLGKEHTIILEMIDFRLVIETEYARIAAKLGSKSDLDRIRSSIEQMDAEIAGGDIGLGGDNAFHDAVAMATHNTVFLKMLQMSKSLLSRTRELTLSIEGQPKLSVEDHWKIYEAIETGDPDEAAKQMRIHLEKAQRNAADRGILDEEEKK